MSTFESILTSATPLSDIKDIPPIPQGTYYAQIKGPHEMVTSSKKGTKGMEVTFRLLQARDDVDQTALDNHLTLANRALADVEMKSTFWESPYLEQSLRDFFRACGMDESWSIKQCTGNLPGRNVGLYVINAPTQRPDGTMGLRAEIQRFVNLD